MPLQVLQVDAAGFMGQTFSYKLPSKGLILVQGTNGSGKSSRFVDAISYGLWGKTERGVDPWDADKGSLTVRCNDLTVSHAWSGKSGTCKVQSQTKQVVSVTTKTALAQMIAQAYMPFEAWKLCARFTSADISAFSRAVASKELTMLESVLELSWLKAAASTAEKQHLASQKTAQSARAEVNTLAAQLQQIAARQETAATALGAPPVPPNCPRPEKYAEAQQRRQTCPTCGASTYHTESLSPEAHRENQAFAAWQQYDSDVLRYRQMQERLDVSRLHAARQRGEVLHIDALLEAIEHENDAAIWEAVRSVFRPGGVREHLLTQELARVSHLATHYCQVMGLDAQIQLKIQQNGKLDMQVVGVGGRHGYAGASSGQRRRVDIALSLALTSNNRYKEGPLWFDEVFDTLDVEGVERVAQLILHLGATRQVLLLTHKKEALQLLQPLAAQTFLLE
jgi:DNA repair exonuclease SbcCD ATPase subunit